MYGGVPGEFYSRIQQLLGQWGLDQWCLVTAVPFLKDLSLPGMCSLATIVIGPQKSSLFQGTVMWDLCCGHGGVNHNGWWLIILSLLIQTRRSHWSWLSPHEEGRPCFSLWPSHRPHCWPCFGKSLRPIFILLSTVVFLRGPVWWPTRKTGGEKFTTGFICWILWSDVES